MPEVTANHGLRVREPGKLPTISPGNEKSQDMSQHPVNENTPARNETAWQVLQALPGPVAQEGPTLQHESRTQLPVMFGALKHVDASVLNMSLIRSYSGAKRKV